MDLDPKYDNYDFPYEAAEPQDGHAGHLTEGQIAQVHQLRMMLEAEGITERLDTLTLVCGCETSGVGEKLMLTCILVAFPESSQVRCRPFQADVSAYNCQQAFFLAEQVADNVLGSSTLKPGARRSTSMHPCRPGTTPRSPRFPSTTSNSTTRSTRLDYLQCELGPWTVIC